MIRIFGRPFGDVTANSEPSRPRQISQNVFLVDTASHESFGAHLEPILVFGPAEDLFWNFRRPFEAVEAVGLLLENPRHPAATRPRYADRAKSIQIKATSKVLSLLLYTYNNNGDKYDNLV